MKFSFLFSTFFIFKLIDEILLWLMKRKEIKYFDYIYNNKAAKIDN